MTKPDLNAIEAAAREVQHKAWTWSEELAKVQADAKPDEGFGGPTNLLGLSWDCDADDGRVAGRFAAAADPEAVLTMIAEIRRLESDLALVRSDLDVVRSDLKRVHEDYESATAHMKPTEGVTK